MALRVHLLPKIGWDRGHACWSASSAQSVTAVTITVTYFTITVILCPRINTAYTNKHDRSLPQDLVPTTSLLVRIEFLVQLRPGSGKE